MEGPPLHTIRSEADYRDVTGIIPRTVDLIFAEVAELQKRGWVFEVHASFLEIYNEAVSDLLREGSAVKGSSESVDVRMAPNGDVQAVGARRIRVTDAAAMHLLLMRASQNRHTAA